MKLEEIEKALRSMDKDLRDLRVEGRNGGDVLLSSMVGHLSDIQESNLPNVIILFLDANLHIQPASFGMLVEERDIVIKVTVLLDKDADLRILKKSVDSLELAIRAATSILSAQVAVA